VYAMLTEVRVITGGSIFVEIVSPNR